MKALIVCDDESAIKKIDAALQECGYGTIIYRWLLKALDNIEEISPDITVISVSDYPRHWKVLAQFINSGIGRNKDTVLLYTPADLSDEEYKKARTLGITGFIHGLDENAQELKTVCGSIENAGKTVSTENDSEKDAENGKIPSVDEILSDSKDAVSKTHAEPEHHGTSGGLKKKCEKYAASIGMQPDENCIAHTNEWATQKNKEKAVQPPPLDATANNMGAENSSCSAQNIDCCVPLVAEKKGSCKSGTIKRWNSILRHIQELYEK